MCIKPLRCTINESGRPTFHADGEQSVGCGKCHECVTLGANDWAMRVEHELGEYDDNCCVTLTYAPENLPPLYERKRQFQLFMKKLRKKYKKKISVLVSHEFGSETARLHHHAILFGVDFYDKNYWKTTPKGTRLYRSKSLESLWTHGHSNIGDASVKAGYYIASYALKLQSKDVMTPDGEILTLKDCMDSSRNPAIGLRYLRRNFKQMVERGDRLCRYYIKKMREYEFKTSNDPKLRKRWENYSQEEKNIRKEMYDYLIQYQTDQLFYARDPHETLAKYELYRSKLQESGGLRKNMFDKKDNESYKYYKSEILDNIHIGSSPS